MTPTTTDDNSPMPRTQLQCALYLIPVPLSDTSAAADVLPAANLGIIRELRHFVVEDLRSARRFLRRVDRSFDIDGSTFVELNEHTRRDRRYVDATIEALRQGHPVGLLSEAGCPAVADPGAEAVAVAQREGYRVIPLVGPSSILMALMASGFNGQSFAFNGYLPIDHDQRIRTLREYERRARASASQTQVFIEAPYRNNKLLALLADTLRPDTLICVASDITGERESIITRTAAQWARSRADYDRIPTIFLIGSSDGTL